MYFIDTHTHLQASVFDDDLEVLIQTARDRGVVDMVICAGAPNDWDRCEEIAHAYSLSYTLGIHPLDTPEVVASDIDLLDKRVANALEDPHFVGIGEIGIDGFVGSRRRKTRVVLC